MEHLPLEELDEQNQIEKVKLDKNLDVPAKKTMLAEVRKSFSARKQSSFKTVMSLANMMVGSAILVLPLRFYTAGFGSCIIAVSIMAFFSFMTARLISIHLKSEEKDFVQSIERVLGTKWQKAYLISSQLILWLGGIIYFLVVSNIMYSIFTQLISGLPKKDTITYAQFSYQWAGAILVVICFLLFNLRDMKVILKLSSKGIFCILFYFIFISFLAIKSIALGKVSFGYSGTPNTQVIYFTQCGFKSFLQALGVFALSFLIHNIMSPVLKSNKHQKKNQRDLGLSFVFGTSILIFAGFVGLVAVFWREITVDGQIINAGSNANTVMDLFDNSDTLVLVLLIISEVLLCFQLISVVPIIAFLCRTQLFNMIYGQDGIPPNWAFYTFSGVFTVIIYIFQIFNFEPIVLIEYAGTVGGYIIAYLLPLAMHFYSLSKYHKKKVGDESATGDQIITHNFRENETDQDEPLLANASFATVFADQEKQSKVSPMTKYVFYGAVLLYGTLLIVIQVSGVEC